VDNQELRVKPLGAQRPLHDDLPARLIAARSIFVVGCPRSDECTAENNTPRHAHLTGRCLGNADGQFLEAQAGPVPQACRG
jgi:hypothetical protein